MARFGALIGVVIVGILAFDSLVSSARLWSSDSFNDPTAGSLTGSQAEREVRAEMQAQQDAWNRGDVEAFLGHYSESPPPSFFSNGRMLRGRSEIGALMRERYKEGMGQLTYGDPHFEVALPEVAVVWGEWRVQLPNGQERRGLGTAVLRKLEGQWRIVHDHSSFAMPPTR
ncbi:MAG: YybH family protein [Candidatus Acidiferrales bacterium]